MPKTNADIFVRMVRARSLENEAALRALASLGLHGVSIGILRQELDSMVRVIFLKSRPKKEREELIRAMLAGEVWKLPTANGKLAKVTDRDMVDHAKTLHGWTEAVYRFGCAFVHLSQFHDYATTDPVAALTPADRASMLYYLRHYHRGPARTDFTLEDVVPMLQSIFSKIKSNLDCELKDLESTKSTSP